MKKNIPIAKPYFDRSEYLGIQKVLQSGWVTQGRVTAEFEKQFAAYVGARYAVATTSCTTALYLALEILGIGERDEVIVPSFTFIATVNSIVHRRATPVFADIDPKTYNIDPLIIEKHITKRTKAILFVDQLGLPADYDAIHQTAKRYRLHLIEDAACALGSEYKRKRVGSLSQITCFSLHPRKLITTGEGGMITTNDKTIYQKAQMLRNHGMSLSDFARHQNKTVVFETYKAAGYNFRLTDIQAAMGIAQMGKLPKILKDRSICANRYNTLLSLCPTVTTPFVPPYAKHNWQSYIIRLNDTRSVSRDQVMQKLLDYGIHTRRGVMASHMEAVYRRGISRDSLPNTRLAVQQTMLLPLYYGIKPSEQEYIVSTLKKILS